MFPDAPSVRALKHLEELAALSREGFICHVLFVIMHSEPAVFIPNLHTDPAFAAALSALGHAPHPAPGAAVSGGGPVAVHAVLLRCSPRGAARAVSFSVPVDLSRGALAAGNGGSYLVLLQLARNAAVLTGALGKREYAKGWYVYAGSAKKNLHSRIARHLRKTRKKKHWHIDYLSQYAEKITGFPIMSYRNLECDLARALERIGGTPVPGFGCSDCSCGSHLFYFAADPSQDRAFAEMLFHFRHVEAFTTADSNSQF